MVTNILPNKGSCLLAQAIVCMKAVASCYQCWVIGTHRMTVIFLIQFFLHFTLKKITAFVFISWPRIRTIEKFSPLLPSKLKRSIKYIFFFFNLLTSCKVCLILIAMFINYPYLTVMSTKAYCLTLLIYILPLLLNFCKKNFKSLNSRNLYLISISLELKSGELSAPTSRKSY